MDWLSVDVVLGVLCIVSSLLAAFGSSRAVAYRQVVDALCVGVERLRDAEGGLKSKRIAQALQGEAVSRGVEGELHDRLVKLGLAKGADGVKRPSS